MTGQAISLVSADEFQYLSDIERLIQNILPREVIDGFEPIHSLPESRLTHKPIRPKKPKSPQQGHRNGQRSGESAQGHKVGRQNVGNSAGNKARPSTTKAKRPSSFR
jgi:ATP-dependent RNA helicase RhlE